MPHLNVEIKAKCTDLDLTRQILLQQNPESKGTDHQIDTYFKVSNGRLKLRTGNIENNLIHYSRENTEGSKRSEVALYKPSNTKELAEVLECALGILQIVDKQREIYFIDNVKFHFDTVKDLGTFVEIEAIDNDGSHSEEKLREQCESYMKLLKIQKEDLIAVSYSDLVATNQAGFVPNM